MGRKTREKRARARAVALPARPASDLRTGLRTWRSRIAWRACAYPLLLGLLAVAAYANSFRVPLLLDDFRVIENDPAIIPPISLGRVLATERPLLTASLALNYALGRADVTGYHALNLLAHFACGLLVYGFMCHLLRGPALGERFGPRASQLAAATAGMFLLHPIQTESVTYINQRVEIFAAMAVLSGLWLAVAAAEAEDRRPHLAALVGVGVLGVLSKPLVTALPFLFALYDWCFIARGEIRATARRWPIYLTLVGIAGAGVLWILAHPAKAAGFEMEGMTFSRYLGSQPGVVLYYLRLVTVPDRLCFDCGYLGAWPVLHSALGDRVALPALVLVAGVLAAGIGRTRSPLVAFAPLAAVGLLLPTSLFPLADVYFEHRLYLAIAFLALLVVTVAFSAGEVTVRRGWLEQRTVRTLRAAALLVVWGALTFLTAARNELLADPFHLWQDTLTKAPEASRAHNALGLEYQKRGQSELAIEHFRESVRQGPNLRVFVNLGAELEKVGRYGEAVEAYEGARGRNPDVALVQHNLARTYPRVGRLEDALRAAERAVALKPADPTYGRALANLRRQVASSEGRPR